MKTVFALGLVLFLALLLAGCLDTGTQIPLVPSLGEDQNGVPDFNGLVPSEIDVNADQNQLIPDSDDDNAFKIAFCESLPLGKPQYLCYLEYALLLQDHSVCQEKAGFYDEVCASLMDRNCSGVTVTPFRDYCFLKWAVRGNHSGLCQSTSSSVYSSSCVSAAQGNPLACSSIYRSSCFFESALRDQNSEYCADTNGSASDSALPLLCLQLLQDQNQYPDINWSWSGIDVNADQNVVDENAMPIVPSDSHGTLNETTGVREFNMIVDRSGFTPELLYANERETVLIRLQALDARHNFYAEYQQESAVITLDRIVEKNETVAVSFTIPAQSEIYYSCYVNCDSTATGTVSITLN